MKTGKFWVLGIFAVAAALGLAAVLYWKRPETRVRWSFTQLHGSLLRNRKETAAHFVAPRVTLAGKEMSRAEFLDTYQGKFGGAQASVAPCPAVADHRLVVLDRRTYCFVLGEKLWQLHWVDEGPCRCR